MKIVTTRPSLRGAPRPRGNPVFYNWLDPHAALRAARDNGPGEQLLKIIQLLSLILMLSLVATTEAKWATPADAVVQMAYQQHITVNQDGTNQEVREIKFTILKEPGRDLAANYTLKYNGNSEKIQILTAKTSYKGNEYQLDNKLMEDKPLASAHGGFDQMRQILLAFPKAEIGATIYLKYKIITKEVPLPNFYATLFSFGADVLLEQAQVTLKSAIPLYLLVNDPQKVLQIKTSGKNNKISRLTIDLIKPLYQAVINEPRFGIINKKYLTWVSVSSLNKWEDLGARFSQSYQAILAQPLPPELLQIASVAAKQTTTIAKINTAVAMLNDKVQYMGDWRTINGQFIPRDLAKISSAQLGDCKDFAAATAAILRSIGFKTQIACIRRGEKSFYPESLPDLAAFNHAIVKVTDQTNHHVYWIDPTNFQSMAGKIFADIAGKMALVIDATSPKYEPVAKIDYHTAQTILTRTMVVLKNNEIIETGNLLLQGENACGLTGATLQTSEASIKDMLYNNLSDSLLEEKHKKLLKLPNLTSRIVQDIHLTYQFTQNDKLITTNLGQALKINYKWLENFFDVSTDYVADVLVFAHPASYKRQTIIKNINIKNITSLNQQITSPWLSIKRQCFINKNNQAQINDTIIIYKNLITNQELKTKEFAALKTALLKNFKDIAIVFTPK